MRTEHWVFATLVLVVLLCSFCYAWGLWNGRSELAEQAWPERQWTLIDLKTQTVVVQGTCRDQWVTRLAPGWKHRLVTVGPLQEGGRAQ